MVFTGNQTHIWQVRLFRAWAHRNAGGTAQRRGYGGASRTASATDRGGEASTAGGRGASGGGSGGDALSQPASLTNGTAGDLAAIGGRQRRKFRQRQTLHGDDGADMARPGSRRRRRRCSAYRHVVASVMAPMAAATALTVPEVIGLFDCFTTQEGSSRKTSSVTRCEWRAMRLTTSQQRHHHGRRPWQNRSPRGRLPRRGLSAPSGLPTRE